jgi:hypothetical protein
MNKLPALGPSRFCDMVLGWQTLPPANEYDIELENKAAASAPRLTGLIVTGNQFHSSEA